MSDEPNPMLPYINRLSLEYEIPLDLARAILGLAAVIGAEVKLAMLVGNDRRSTNFLRAYHGSMMSVGVDLLHLPEKRIAGALIAGLEYVNEAMESPVVVAAVKKQNERRKREQS